MNLYEELTYTAKASSFKNGVYIFKIIDIRKDDANSYVVQIKSAKKDEIIYKTLQEIILDKELIEKFSFEDRLKIYYKYHQHNYIPICSILSHIINEKDEDYFIIRFNFENIEKKYSMLDLIHDHNLLIKLNGADGVRIGFLAGMKSILREVKNKSESEYKKEQ